MYCTFRSCRSVSLANFFLHCSLSEVATVKSGFSVMVQLDLELGVTGYLLRNFIYLVHYYVWFLKLLHLACAIVIPPAVIK